MLVGFTILGTADVARAGGFYDAVMAQLGAGRHPVLTVAHRIVYARGQEPGLLEIGLPYDGRPAGVGNGTMVGLVADSAGMVQRAHAAALAAGGTCEGEPGERGAGWYGAYFRDPDGNKLAVYTLLQAPRD
jgi:catechol 2,3-dioxygenase-like lactoylglutathione lyase family enzyme